MATVTDLNYKGLKFRSPQQYDLFLQAIDRLHNDDRYYASLAYCISVTGKSDLLKYLHDHAVEAGKIIRAIGVYSSGEKAMIKLGLHLFNSNNCKNNTIDDVFTNASSWVNYTFNVLAFRYGRN